MHRGDFDYRVANDIVFYKWMGSKPVTVVSNFHGTDTAKVSRMLRDGSKSNLIVHWLLRNTICTWVESI